MKKSMLAAILAGIVLFVAGCCDCEDLTDGTGNNGGNGGNGGNIDPALAGIWVYESNNFIGIYIFNEDGRVEHILKIDNSTHSNIYTYSANNNILCMDNGVIKDCQWYGIIDNILICDDDMNYYKTNKLP
jgi:hypothetical protein